MEITLAELAADARTIMVPTVRGDVEVTYRPSHITPEFEAQASSAARPALLYAADLVSWGLVDNKRAEYPRTERALRTIPLSFLEAVRQAVEADVEGDEHIVRDLRRAITTSGNVGQMRWWYPLIRASRFLGVGPWELARQPSQWKNWALQSETAEIQAHNEMVEQATKKAQQKGRRR